MYKLASALWKPMEEEEDNDEDEEDNKDNADDKDDEDNRNTLELEHSGIRFTVGRHLDTL